MAALLIGAAIYRGRGRTPDTHSERNGEEFQFVASRKGREWYVLLDVDSDGPPTEFYANRIGTKVRPR